jgi:hypothetical protein
MALRAQLSTRQARLASGRRSAVAPRVVPFSSVASPVLRSAIAPELSLNIRRVGRSRVVVEAVSGGAGRWLSLARGTFLLARRASLSLASHCVAIPQVKKSVGDLSKADLEGEAVSGTARSAPRSSAPPSCSPRSAGPHR